MYYLSMAVVILSMVGYSICQKSINGASNPAISMIATYIVAIIVTLVSVIFFPEKEGILLSFKQLNWASYALGITAVGLEIGFLMVYRSGWDLAIAPLLSSVASGVVLIILGIILYKSKLSIANIMGIGMSIAGLILMNKKG